MWAEASQGGKIAKLFTCNDSEWATAAAAMMAMEGRTLWMGGFGDLWMCGCVEGWMEGCESVSL